MYYFYLMLSAAADMMITVENRLVQAFHDIWKPILMFPLLFSACVILHVAVSALLSLTASRNRKWTNINNLYRIVTLELIDLFLHIMKARVHISGEELLPEDKKFLLVGNHLSIFDPMIAMLYFRDKDLAFVSKKENIEIPFGGRLMLASGCIGLDRENNRTAIQTIKQASCQISNDIASMGIYPEGGINKSENVLLPFHHGSFKIATKAEAPIVVTTVRNTEKLCHRFLFAPTDIYFDIIRVISPEEISGMKTNDISSMVWDEMYEHLTDNRISVCEGDADESEATEINF